MVYGDGYDSRRPSFGGEARDNFLASKIDTETKRAIEAEEYLQSQIEDGAASKAARYLDINQNYETGVISLAILNKNYKKLDEKEIDITGKLVKSAILDINSKKIILVCLNNELVECDVSYILDTLSDHETRIITLESGLAAEIERATLAEETLDDKIDAEIDRATDAENDLDDKIDDEIERATTKENQLEDALNAEIERAGNAEDTLQDNIDAEAESRQEGDNTLDTRITNEVNTLTGLINDEETRAKGVEAELRSDLTDETSARTDADTDLNNRIDALYLATVGTAGSYIKTVGQVDGQLSATSQTFDSTIPQSNPSAINAPTTDAVKTYVDVYGGKIDTASIDGVNLPLNNKNLEIPTVRTDTDNQELSSTQKTNAKTNLDLENVDNTADLDKPISTATQNALDDKADKEGILPYIETLNTTFQIFVNAGLINKPFILYYKGSSPTSTESTIGYYLSILYNDSAFGYHYEFEKLGTDDRYVGLVTTANFISQVLTSTYQHNYEDTKNKVTSISSSSTDTKYPSAKAVYNAIQAKETYRIFPASWTTNSTTLAFCQSVENDSTAVAGTSYLGTLRCRDLPNMVQAEAIVDIISEGANGKCIDITITSLEVSPYRWTFSYGIVNGNVVTVGWLGNELSDNKVTSLSNTSTDDQYPSAKCVYDFVEEKTEKLSYQETLEILQALTMPEGTAVENNNINFPEGVEVVNNNINL